MHIVGDTNVHAYACISILLKIILVSIDIKTYVQLVKNILLGNTMNAIKCGCIQFWKSRMNSKFWKLRMNS